MRAPSQNLWKPSAITWPHCLQHLSCPWRACCLFNWGAFSYYIPAEFSPGAGVGGLSLTHPNLQPSQGVFRPDPPVPFLFNLESWVVLGVFHSSVIFAAFTLICLSQYTDPIGIPAWFPCCSSLWPWSAWTYPIICCYTSVCVYYLSCYIVICHPLQYFACFSRFCLLVMCCLALCWQHLW